MRNWPNNRFNLTCPLSHFLLSLCSAKSAPSRFAARARRLSVCSAYACGDGAVSVLRPAPDLRPTARIQKNNNKKDKIRKTTWIKKPCFQLKTKKEEGIWNSITDRSKEGIWYFQNFAQYEVRRQKKNQYDCYTNTKNEEKPYFQFFCWYEDLWQEL